MQIQPAYTPALGAGLLRRFCGCDFVRTCACGQPRPRCGWTVEGLARLRALMREHGDLARVAVLMGESRHRCNIALNALIGRTPTHALAALEALAERRPSLSSHGSA